MIIYAEYSVDKVLPLLGQIGSRGFVENKTKHPFHTDHGTFEAKVNTTRLRCFANSHACVKCGIEGKVFRLEKNESEAHSPHLNLYAEKEGEMILMTQDHIVPKSRGGKDHMSNLQTMCFKCNEEKGTKEWSPTIL